MRLILMFWRRLMLPSSWSKELGPTWLWRDKGGDMFWYIGRLQVVWSIRTWKGRGSGALSRTVGSVEAGSSEMRRNDAVQSHKNENCEENVANKNYIYTFCFWVLGGGKCSSVLFLTFLYVLISYVFMHVATIFIVIFIFCSLEQTWS
jgi:hypothetical protein